jgi:hypothetical protein
MSYIANITRPAGDPKILQSGPSSLGLPDVLGRALGWFSLGLGVVELFAARRVTAALGMTGKEGLVRAYGAREIGAGVLSLSLERELGLWSRVAGDGLDLATLLSGLRAANPKRGNVALALLLVGGITAIDVIGANAVAARHSRRSMPPRSYRDRSGFPQGVEKSRGAARDFRTPRELRSEVAPSHQPR